MATIKSYTDLEQSKKLAKILPIESADMYYGYGKDKPEFLPISDADIKCLSQPCWSLAALIKMLPKGFLLMDMQYETDLYSVWVPGFDGMNIWKNNTIDTCYETILKLNELNLL